MASACGLVCARIAADWMGGQCLWIGIGRTVPLLKPPQNPHCYLGEVDRAKKFPPPTPTPPTPPLATRQARSYRANWATQTLLFSKPLDLAQVCHGNKICSKPALTWKLTLVLACAVGHESVVRKSPSG